MTERLAFDTNAIIYFVERVEPYIKWLDPVFASVQSGERQAVASVVSEAEALVRPLRNADLDALRKIRAFFSAPVEVIEYTREIAMMSARVRAEVNLKLPDAIVVATALASRCDALVGNDAAFSSRVRDIPFIHLDKAVGKA